MRSSVFIRLSVVIGLSLTANSGRGSDGILSKFEIDGRVTITEKRTYFSMERHPDGKLYLAAQDIGLYKSTDNGQSWTIIPWKYHPTGFGITKDGRLWMVTPPNQEVSKTVIGMHQSSDGGQSWQSCDIDYGPLAPGGDSDPYTIIAPDSARFLERPDGTVMFSCSMRWDDWLQKDQSRPDIRGVMLRSTDGGKTWGDPTIVNQYAGSTDYAVGPKNPDHILGITRIQRDLLPREDPETTGCSFGWEYKNGLLLESTDGGRTFREVPGSLTRCYGHMGTILWTENNVVVVVHQHGYETVDERIVSGNNGGWIEGMISLNGGRTWVDDTQTGTPYMNEAKTFTLVPYPGGHMEPAPTVEVSLNHFFTAYITRDNKRGIDAQSCGVYWHIETDGQSPEK